MLRGGRPHNAVIDDCVPVRQHVAETDDARQIGYQRSGLRIDTAKVLERFTNDLELSLDGRPTKRIGQVAVLV